MVPPTVHGGQPLGIEELRVLFTQNKGELLEAAAASQTAPASLRLIDCKNAPLDARFE